ncbi:hypothetical protein HQ585_15020 [candidate division KSB1 bacterium]|nr:hypothetical protein [candidate division KSB1 bacterium]
MERPRFSEETILSVSKTTLANGRSTFAALSDFGVTEETLNTFEAKIQSAEALPFETQNRIELRGLTGHKDEELDACHLWGRKLRLRLQMAFGRGSSQAGSFPSKEFKNAENSENTMMSVMKVLIDLADKYKIELAGFGQTPEILAEGNECLNQLKEADASQENKKDNKKQSTQERYQQFKVLYDTIIRINRVGRLVFENDPVHLALFESKWPKA